MGRQCQIKTMVPSTELIPPVPEAADSETTPHMIPIKLNATEGSQNLDDKKEDNVREEEPTVEPLGPIVITDPPSTIDPAATVGKWPTEPPTEPPVVERDDENETWNKGSDWACALTAGYFIYLFILIITLVFPNDYT